jgi:hypothetical protein
MLSALPAMAAPRGRGGLWDRDFPFFSKVIAKIKKTFGVTTSADTLTLPNP